MGQHGPAEEGAVLLWETLAGARAASARDDEDGDRGSCGHTAALSRFCGRVNRLNAKATRARFKARRGARRNAAAVASLARCCMREERVLIL